MLKSKAPLKKPMFAKNSIESASSLKIPGVKKEPTTSTQVSAKEDPKLKNNLYQKNEITQNQGQKPSFLKGKVAKNDDYLKKKSQLDKIIYEKYMAKEKIKNEKKIDGRQSFNEKYHDYFDFKNNTRPGDKKYNQKLSDSGGSANSLNSIQSEGSKRIIPKRYEPQKTTQAQKPKSTVYSLKNEKVGGNSVKAPIKPKQIVRNHGRMRSTVDNEEPQGSKPKGTEMKSLSPKVTTTTTYPHKIGQPKVTTIKSTQTKNYIKKPIKNDYQNSQSNPKSIGKDSSGSFSTLQNNSKKVEPIKSKISFVGNKKKVIQSPLVMKAGNNVRTEKKATSYQSQKSSGSIKIPQKVFKPMEKVKKIEAKPEKKDEPIFKLMPFSSKEEIKFVVIKKLAEHEESTAYLCLHPETQSIYCLKACYVKEDKLAQLIKQIKIGSQLTNPNLVKTYCALHNKKYIYLVMEYMDDQTLFHVLQEKTFRYQRIQTTTSQSKCPFTQHLSKVNKIRDILKQLLKAVQHLHENGIAHRDIKPQNIFISHQTYKLGDFGSSTFNNSQEYIGTLDYASPQILQKKPYDHSIDMWSVGCIAYQLDVGRPPFFHIDRNETIRRIINIEYDSSTISDPDLKDMVQKLLIIPGNFRLSAKEALEHPFLHQLVQSRTRA